MPYPAITKYKRTALSFLTLLTFCFVQHAHAQLRHVQFYNGSGWVGNTLVTIKSPTPNIPNVSTNACVVHPNFTAIGGVHNKADSFIKFILSKPARHIKVRITALEDPETVHLNINGVFYPIKISEISRFNCSNCGYDIQVANGKVSTPTISTSVSCFDIDVHYPGIDSVKVHHNMLGGGAHLAFFFEEDTTAFIKQPFTDTALCPGDTIPVVYSTSFRFRNGNVFTAQLSNDTGAFISPINIGTHTDTTGDTIWCTIPKNIAAGNGYRIRILSTLPVDTSVDNYADIRIKAAPASFSGTSNTPVCEGDTIKLNGASTSSGISWSWAGPNSFTSQAEDTIITNAANGHAGDYVLTATLNNTGCSFKDTTTVVIKDTPDSVKANSNSPVCETKTITLSASATTTGVSWSWSGPSSYSNNTQNPTVSNNASSSNAGSYIATANLNGCTASDTTTVVVLPKPNKPTASSNSPICINQDLGLTATNISGAKYNWYGPVLFADTMQNPTIQQAQANRAGTYFVYATVSGCVSDTDSVVVVVNADPQVTVFPSPGSTICDGQEATFTTLANNAGASPTYKWTVNHTPVGATGTIYKTTTLKNGDVVRCEMLSTGTCLQPFTDTSAAITMTVQQLLAPQVNITANPNHTLFPNEPIKFTALPLDAGANPSYQWTRNGTPVGGATSNVWGANANFLNDGDEICAIVYSDYACPSPDSAKSNCITVQINVGVDDVGKGSALQLYPNPNTGEFTLKGSISKTDGAKLEIRNITGQVVYQQELHVKNGQFSEHIKLGELPSGVYVLIVKTDTGNATIRFSIKK